MLQSSKLFSILKGGGVLIENGAGEGSGFSDEEYKRKLHLWKMI